MQISIKFDKSGAMLVNPRVFSNDVSKGVNIAMINAGNFVMGELQKATPVGFSGVMRKNWYLTASKLGLNDLVEVEIANDTDYMNAVNIGRKASPINAKGMRSLTLWVQRKLRVADPKKARGIAFAIAKKKAKHDTPGQRFVENTIEEAMPVAITRIIEPGIQKAIDDAL